MSKHGAQSWNTSTPAPCRSSGGFTLVELMIAMLLGLIVVAGVTSVFLAGQRSYRTNRALGDVQDSSRIAFEMMAQDIRKAGLTGCDSTASVANLLNNGPVATGGAPDWWVDFDNAIKGFGSGTVVNPDSAAASAAGTDSLIVLGAADSGFSVNAKGDKGVKKSFTLYENDPGFDDGDIVMMCDPGQAALFQLGNVGGKGKNFDIAKASNGKGKKKGAGSPGNCTENMAYPTVCGKGNDYPFEDNSQVAALTAADWYVDNNNAGGRSLYRIALQNVGGEPTPTTSEMVRNVTQMSLSYHQGQDADFVNAKDVNNWRAVNAVRVVLTVQSDDQHASINGAALTKTFAATMTLRNRVN